jgi:hypothetical protein
MAKIKYTIERDDGLNPAPSQVQPDPALHAALKRRQNYDTGGVVDGSDDNAGLPIPTAASAQAGTAQPITAAPSPGPQLGNVGGGGQTMPGQSQFGQFQPAPNFPRIDTVANAYNPALRALPTNAQRLQQAQAALQPFINALQQLKASSTPSR